mgnify:CR=1 FL=1
MKQIRMHIQIGEQRTTISVDDLLVGLLAIKLGKDPSDTRVVREWLQEHLPAKIGTDRGIGKRASQHARILLIEAVADKDLSVAYDNWILER